MEGRTKGSPSSDRRRSLALRLPCFEWVHNITHFPKPGSHSCGHCRGYFERLVDTDEIVKTGHSQNQNGPPHPEVKYTCSIAMPPDGSARDAVCGCSRFRCRTENNFDVGSRLTTLTRWFQSKFIKVSGQGHSGVPTLSFTAPQPSVGTPALFELRPHR
jgi:hypothetical protein